MKLMNLSEFKTLKATEIMKLLPVTLLVDSVPMFVVDTPEHCIVTSDLHPRVSNMLHMMERKARVGMPIAERAVLEPKYDPDIEAKIPELAKK